MIRLTNNQARGLIGQLILLRDNWTDDLNNQIIRAYNNARVDRTIYQALTDPIEGVIPQIDLNEVITLVIKGLLNERQSNVSETLDHIARVVAQPLASNRLSTLDIHILRSALLGDEEKEQIKIDETKVLTCGCGHKFQHHGEMATIVDDGNGLSLRCSNCYNPIYVACSTKGCTESVNAGKIQRKPSQCSKCRAKTEDPAIADQLVTLQAAANRFRAGRIQVRHDPPAPHVLDDNPFAGYPFFGGEDAED